MKHLLQLCLKLFLKLNPLQKQNILYYAGITGGAVLLSAVIWNVTFASTGPFTTHGAKPTEKVLTGASRLNPQDAWNERMNTQFDVQEKQIADLTKMITALNEKLNQAAKGQRDTNENFPSASTHKAGAPSQKPSILDVSIPSDANDEGKNTQASTAHGESKKRFRSSGISKQTISLLNSRMGKPLDTVDNTIPPGSFAQGILLSGVDHLIKFI